MNHKREYMKHYEFSKVEIDDKFISVNVYKNNNYTFRIEAEILHLEHTQDIEDILYKEFREFALECLYYSDYIPDVTADVIHICQYIRMQDKNLVCP